MMNGPKKWVSSKVHRKTSSQLSFSSNNSSSQFGDGPSPPPPIRLLDEDVTAATAFLDFGSGSTLTTQRSDGHGLVAGPPTLGSHSSIDSILTMSPSTTPPKKTWEKNYKSFLKRTGKHDSKATLSSLPARVHHTVPAESLPRVNSLSAQLLSDIATSQLSQSHLDHPLFPSPNSEDFAPGLVDGFEDYSQPKSKSGGSTVDARGNHSAINDDGLSHTAPSSPTKNKEFNSRGSVFFKRMRRKTKSVDNLDTTMRRGVDRKSPTNTPRGSAASTPIRERSLWTASPDGLTTLQDGIEKAALLSDLLSPQTLASSSLLESHSKHRLGPSPVPSRFSSQGNYNVGNLDQPRHRGITSSIVPTATLSRTPTPSTALSSRVQSMGSNLIIPEGEPVINNSEEQKLNRERRKAFTDFHNMGIDSSSAYLGDELSLHKHSMFLSAMAYPAGSAGDKAHTCSTCSGQSGPHSLDQRRASASPSTSMNSISENTPLHNNSDGVFLPERSLQSLKDLKHWMKGERHAIIPGVLCMCPIQVLNNIMSKGEGSSSTSSLTSGCPHRGSGIGSVVSEDDRVDSSGWFLDHQTSSEGGTFHRCGMSSLQSCQSGRKILGKATVAPLGMRSYLNEVYGWCTGVFVLRQNYLFEYREGDSLNGLPWGYAHLPLAEAYPHKHFTNALYLDFFERPCSKSGKRSLLLRLKSKMERDRWVLLLQSAARMTLHDLYHVDESDGAPEFGHGRYAIVRPAKRRFQEKAISFSETHCLGTTSTHDSSHSESSLDRLVRCSKSSNPRLDGVVVECGCALKIIDKAEFWSCVRNGGERADTLVREAAIQTTLAVQGGDTPGFLRLENIFETGEKLVLELELLGGRDLFQYVSSRGVLDEVEAAHIMRDLLICLQMLDRIGIAHRDIKPSNILMCHDEDGNGTKIKLADFGMASFVGVDNLVRGRCGTPGFVAPEILLSDINGGYGNKVDMFSAGVTLYVMLAGYEPFYGETDRELVIANIEAKMEFPHADWHSVSVEGQDLIERMVVADPLKRIGPSEALRHPWITRRATALQNDNCSQ